MRRAPRLLAGALALTLGLLAACGDDGGDAGSTTTALETTTTAAAASTATTAGAEAGPTLTVMSRNLYLGADLLPLFESTPETLEATALATWQQVVDSEVETRMGLVADEIAEHEPDVVALQEATLWSIQAEGAAEPVAEYDFLALLLAELADRGVPYTAVASGDGFAGGLPVSGVGLVQMQDRDVLLVRDDADHITVDDTRSGSFEARMTVEIVGAPIEVVRGWAAADLTVDGTRITVVNTHLEAFDDPVRDAQQAELMAAVDATGLPAIVLGDLNSAAGGEDPTAYEAMLAAGFEDAWVGAGGGDGFTCCFAADLRGGGLDTRIDFVLARGGFTALDATVVGDEVLEPVAASDHAGVVVALALPPS